MKRGAPLKRRTPLKRVNWERRARRLREQFGPQARLCRGLRCCVPGCRARGRSDPAHVRSRAAGGRDLGNVVPLCRRHHREQHARGIKTFQAAHGIDLVEVAARLAKQVNARRTDQSGEKGAACRGARPA